MRRTLWMKSIKHPRTTGVTQMANGREEEITNDRSGKTLKAAKKPRRAIQVLIINYQELGVL